MLSKPEVANTIGCGACETLVRVKFPYPSSGRKAINKDKIGDWVCVYSGTKSPVDVSCLRILGMASLSANKLVASTESSEFVLMDFSFKCDKVADDFLDEVNRYLSYLNSKEEQTQV